MNRKQTEHLLSPKLGRKTEPEATLNLQENSQTVYLPPYQRLLLHESQEFPELKELLLVTLVRPRQLQSPLKHKSNKLYINKG